MMQTNVLFIDHNGHQGFVSAPACPGFVFIPRSAFHGYNAKQRRKFTFPGYRATHSRDGVVLSVK